MKFVIGFTNADTLTKGYFPARTNSYLSALDLFVDYCQLNHIFVLDGSILVSVEPN